MPAAARLLARKELRRRAATEGNGKVNCARRHPRRGRRLRTPAATRGVRRSGRQQGRREGGAAAALVVRPAATESEQAGAASDSRVRKGAASLGDRSGRGARWRSPSKRSIRFRGWWSRATRSARAHVELFGVPGVTCVQDLPDGVLYPTPPLSARRVIAPTVHSVREYSPEQPRLRRHLRRGSQRERARTLEPGSCGSGALANARWVLDRDPPPV